MEGPSMPRSIRWRLQLGLLKLPPDEETVVGWTSRDLYDCNSTYLHEQRERCKELLQKHEADLLLAIGAEEEAELDVHDDEGEQLESKNNAYLEDVDPLTAMLMEEQAREKRRQDLDLKYRKERARRKRGIGNEGENHHDYEPNQSDRFDTYSSNQTLGVIDKDLNRLQPEHHTYHHSRKNLLFHHAPNEHTNDEDFASSVKERTARLTEMLHVYAREHPKLGYRQGMHEIASYMLMVVEMDLFDAESSMMQSSEPDGLLTELLHADFLLHDAYVMFEQVMGNLAPAYDVKSSPDQESSPMEEMAKSIVSQIMDVACDKPLYGHILGMNCPPELYCTRWVRLMFSREVLGWRNVLLLWDIFFDLITAHETIISMDPTRYTRAGVTPPLRLGKFQLMHVLESTATSMILLCREKLLPSDANESINVLMNIPPLKNILPLTATLLSMMRRIQCKSMTTSRNDNTSSSSSPSRTTFAETKKSSSFSQRALDAIQQIRSVPGGDSLRKLYATSSRSPERMQSEKFQTESSSSLMVPNNGDPLLGARPHPTRNSNDTMSDNHRSSPTTMVASLNPSFISRRLTQFTKTTTPIIIPEHQEEDGRNDERMSRLEMADKLNQSICTIKNCLVTLDGEKATTTTMALSTLDSISKNSGLLEISDAIWDALNDVDAVRKQLLQTDSI